MYLLSVSNCKIELRDLVITELRIDLLKRIIILILESVKLLQISETDTVDLNQFISNKMAELHDVLKEWISKNAGDTFGNSDRYFSKYFATKEIEV